MRVLCVLNKSPLPDSTGSRRRLLRMVSALAARSEVRVVVVSDSVSIDEAQLIESAVVGQSLPPTAIVRLGSKPASVGDRVRWLSGRSVPFSWTGRDRSAATAGLREQIADFSPDVVWASSAILADSVLPPSPGFPVAIDVAHTEAVAIDSQLRGSLRMILRNPAVWKRTCLLALDRTARIKAEARGLGLASLVTACSPVEADFVRSTGHPRVAVVPNGVDLPKSPGRTAGSRQLLFVGNLGYPPNVESLRILIGEILPRLRQSIPDVQLNVIGARTALSDRISSGPGVVWHGFVDDLAPHYATAELVVVPLVSGSGTKIKVLEAFAYGVPVVTTGVGIAGLAVTNGKEVAVGENAVEMVDLSLSLLCDEAKAAAQGSMARGWVERTHTWEAAGAELDRALSEAVASTSQGRS